MRAARILAIPSAIALVLAFGGCGGDPNDDTVRIADNDRERPSGATVEGAISPVSDDEADASAPARLAEAVLPADSADALAVLQGLPADLIGGSKQISARTTGDLAADYVAADRASRYGIQAMDLRTSMMSAFVSEPVAEELVAVFAEGGDWEVEDAGHENSLHWVAWNSTGSGVGVEGVEKIYSLTWGETGSPWAFVAGAPTEVGRDELIAAFVAAAADVAAAPDPEPATPDEEAAQAALLTEGELGPDWLSWPKIQQDREVFHGLATRLMADEPSCAAALEWLDREELTLSGLLDVFTAGSIARAESPMYVLRSDGMSDIQHTVVVFDDAAQLGEALGSTRHVGWVDCATAIYDDLAQVLFDGALPGVTVSVDTAAERSLDLGDDSVALRFELTLLAPNGGGEIGVTQDISIVAVGRAASAVVQQSFDGGIDDDLMDDVIGRAAERSFEQFGGTTEGGS